MSQVEGAAGLASPGAPPAAALGLGAALALLLVGLLLSATARSQGRSRRPEAVGGDGLLPAVGNGLDLTGRLVAAAGALALLRLAVPTSVAGAVPFLAAAAAFALGWSARDLLRDVFAALVLSASDEALVPGASLSGRGFSGTLAGRRLRGVELVGVDGDRMLVPWRRLLAEPYRVEPHATQPVHTFRVLLPLPAPPPPGGDGDPGGDGGPPPALDRGLRRRLVEAVAASPAVPAGAVPQVLRDPTDPRRVELRVPIVHARFARQVEAEVRDRLAADRVDGSDPGF